MKIQAKMKQIVGLSVLLVVFLVSFPGALRAGLEEQTVVFSVDGIGYRVVVRPVDAGIGSRILLSGKETKDLGPHLEGENLFPVVTVNEGNARFMVSWMNRLDGRTSLCFYDSLLGATRAVALDGFKSAYPLRGIYYRGNPYVLVFEGNNANNRDIFYYHLDNDYIRNITATPESEGDVVIFDEENRFFVEARTFGHEYRYRVKKAGLRSTRTKMVEIPRDTHEKGSRVKSAGALNTIVAFGDSITWGRMYMDDLEGDYHPELAYLEQLGQGFADDYGDVDTINLGFPGDRTEMALQRMYVDFPGVEAYFCLVMLGTNDVMGRFDVDAALENLRLILKNLRVLYGMYPIISTIPPQRRYHPTLQYFTENTEALNEGIIELAVEEGVPYIDAYSAFMNFPQGWLSLLEDFKGTHPSPLGHTVIAGLFRERILEVPPGVPDDVELTEEDGVARTWGWSPNLEFDFGHYHIEFGFRPDLLNREAQTEDNFFRFIPFVLGAPFERPVYFRLRSVDKDGNGSAYTPVHKIDFD